MHAGKGHEDSLRKLIGEVLKSKQPTSVGQLAEMIMNENPTMDEVEFAATVKVMASEGVFSLEQPSYQIKSALDYVFTATASGWLWATLVTTTLALIAVALTPDFFPFSIIRWVMGSILVLYLPGSTVLQLVFSSRSEIDPLERLLLKVGLSLAVVPIIGLILNFTPWGLRFIPITSSLGIFTIATSVAAATRDYLSIRE